MIVYYNHFNQLTKIKNQLTLGITTRKIISLLKRSVILVRGIVNGPGRELNKATQWIAQKETLMKTQMVSPSFFPIPESGSCFRDFENICFFKIPLVYVGPTYVTFLQEENTHFVTS